MPLPNSEPELPALIHRYAPQPRGWQPMREAAGRFVPTPGAAGQLMWPSGEEPTLEAAKRAKLQALSMWRLGQELRGYTIEGVTYDIHPTARILLKQHAAAGRARPLKTRGGRLRPMTPKDLRDVDAAIDVQIERLDRIEEDVQAWILAAPSQDALDAIQLP